MREIRARVKRETFKGSWDAIRTKILKVGGLRDLRSAIPGRGYTGHSFNDWNHCDLTAMRGSTTMNENHDSKGTRLVRGIAMENQLGHGIKVASLPEHGPGGSWSTCIMGCNKEPPQDVAHVQFRSRIAFKLVWVPPDFRSFVLVDDAGDLLNSGQPDDGDDEGVRRSSSRKIPAFRERRDNWRAVEGSKYATVALSLSQTAK